MGAEVRDEVERQLAEAKLRWEARRRDVHLDLDRALASQEARLLRECDRQRASALSKGLRDLRSDFKDRQERERELQDQRCILAVQIALERAVGQGDLRTVCQTLLDAGALPVSGDDNADPATGGDGAVDGTGTGTGEGE